MPPERWEGNWILGRTEVRQPHRTRSRGIGGPGGPLRSTIPDVGVLIEAGARGPGLCDDPWVREAPRPLKFTPKLSKRFSVMGQCSVCVDYPKTYGTQDRPIDGSGMCLEHATEAARKAYAREQRRRANTERTPELPVVEVDGGAPRRAQPTGLSDDHHRALREWGARSLR